MYNPDFWEVRLDPHDLDRYANEAGIWFETSEDNRSQQLRENRHKQLLNPIMDLIGTALTEKQRQVLLLYYMHQKTQEEVAQIMGISRRVVSQHLFGICRNGKHVGGALKKIRKLCHQRGLALQN
ncbi:MAG: sigma-70 family RNA polymerase sigma factor [Gemmatimonadetes bacterium]|jgi:RNA polymerase sigma factor (sigma-70 family)|nr:sigma-70 family RNA polymerase sigma factor [Gemmatimonadota bacterium]